MFSIITIEEEIREHPRVIKLRRRFPQAQIVYCQRYGEVFNRNSQNFRLQKKRPSLILARKFDNFIHDAPAAYGIGAGHNFYFSHMLNCLYDCRYCFLQGMFRSANYLLFINYEDFADAIEEKINGLGDKTGYFFSGYDCDSLAMEPVTGFARYFLPLFRRFPQAIIELRTKSTQIRSLLDMEPFENCVVAFSFTPQEVSEKLEHKVPTIERRLDAMRRLQDHGWNIGLRFDPLIYQPNFKPQYRGLFQKIFSSLNTDAIHSVNIGAFRIPDNYFKKIVRLYPDEKLFAQSFEKTNGLVSYPSALEEHMITFCNDHLSQYVPESKIFHCAIQ